MTEIINLSSVDELSAGDQFPLWSATEGDTRKASLSAMTTYLQDRIGAPQEVTQYASPLTGATVTIGQNNPTWLIITPAGTIATMTLALGTAPANLQEVIVVSSQIITSLTVSATGFSVVGAPTTLAANGFFRMKYDAITTTWRRVG